MSESEDFDLLWNKTPVLCSGIKLDKTWQMELDFFSICDCDFLQSLAMAHQTQSQSEHNNTMITNPWLDPDLYRKFQ